MALDADDEHYRAAINCRP